MVFSIRSIQREGYEPRKLKRKLASLQEVIGISKRSELSSFFFRFRVCFVYRKRGVVGLEMETTD